MVITVLLICKCYYRPVLAFSSAPLISNIQNLISKYTSFSTYRGTLVTASVLPYCTADTAPLQIMVHISEAIIISKHWKQLEIISPLQFKLLALLCNSFTTYRSLTPFPKFLIFHVLKKIPAVVQDGGLFVHSDTGAFNGQQFST
jgi:hypothetical protein